MADPGRGEPTVFVSNIQRVCVHDGPGIRTVVFLLGCPLRCRWCQNPETLEREPRLMVNPRKCAGCGACAEACVRQAAHRDADGAVRFDRSRCEACGRCLPACWYKAREMSGRPYSVRRLLEQIVKDRVAFRNSGGGVTLSGGEPLLHPAFVAELFQNCRRQGIHTAVETCGAVPWGHFEQVLPVTDLFLYDLKLLDPAKHERWTGAGNRLILDNIRALAAGGRRLVVRVPLIPGVNDDDAEFGAIARFAAGLPGVEELHILPFHQVGSSKYALVGRAYELEDLTEDNEARVARCRQLAEEQGLRVSVGGAGFREPGGEAPARRDNEARKRMFLYDL